jgi:hypothetical protein
MASIDFLTVPTAIFRVLYAFLVLSHDRRSVVYWHVTTIQGSGLSSLLGNIYLHYVLDLWFEREVKPRLSGKATLIRYADDRAPRRRGNPTARDTDSH